MPASKREFEPHDYEGMQSVLDPTFQGEIDYLIRMIRMREIAVIDRMLEPLGLGLSAWYPLTLLHVEDGMSQRELGRRLNLKDAAIGKAIDALERAGLVSRNQDPHDRRKSLIILTPVGKKTAKKVTNLRKDFLARLLDGFTDEEREHFISMLERVYRNIDDR